MANTTNRGAAANEPPQKVYTVRATDIESKKKRQAALSEFTSLQDRAIGSHYLDWAAHEVNYAALEDPVSTQKLKQANDAYTMSMLMNCLGPLSEGVKPSSIFQVWFSYKIIETFNPSMSADMSRMYSNLRQDLSGAFDRMRNNGHMSGKLMGVFSPIVSGLDTYLAEKSGSQMENAMRDSLSTGDLDSLVMTPKQVAALKVNFMEQCYADMRAGERPLREIEQDYGTAIGHLEVIAKNSGFDMAVVAAEERYLVGIKMQSNPAYQNVFQESADVYGAHPALDENGLWSGRFETADGHEYTVGGDVHTGAFTVRPPMSDTSAIVQEMTDRAQRFAYMQTWLDSEECPLYDKDKKVVQKQLDACIEEYKSNVIHKVADDGVFTGSQSSVKKKAEDMWQHSFDSAYDAAAAEGTASTAYQDFGAELHRIVDKEVLTKAGLKPDNDMLRDLGNGLDTPGLAPLADYMKQRADAHSDTSRPQETGVQIAIRMRENYIADMTGDEIARLLLHTGANQQQGINRARSNQQQGSNVWREAGAEAPVSQADPAPVGSMDPAAGNPASPDGTRPARSRRSRNRGSNNGRATPEAPANPAPSDDGMGFGG